MDLPEEGPCKLLFVGRHNLTQIVAAIAPDMVLVPRAAFIKVASDMLGIVEGAANSEVPQKA